MAGDWIKMRIDLQSHPKIVRILSATKSDKFRVIGGLHAVWSVFDTHSEDGTLCGYTPETMDHIIGWEGFSQALIQAGWLQFDGAECLVMPEFTEHNGASGKRRAEDSKRKRIERKELKESDNCPQNVQINEDEMQTREEKRREETTTTTQKPSVPACPVEQIIQLYKDTARRLPSVRLVPDSTKAHIRARWLQDNRFQSLEFWQGFFEYCENNKFLSGQSETRGDRKPFRASLAWVVNASNFAKIINEDYA